MENIYKIKIRSNPDPRGLYPSERRYSASTVLGLGVVHLALASTSLLLASLTFISKSPHHNANHTEIPENLKFNNLSIAPFTMSLGALSAGLASLLAWKKWYIDHYITWFFFTSLFSTFTSSLSIISITILKFEPWTLDYKDHKHIKYILALNIFIACILELIWSGLSTKIAYKGMKNTYPDDIIISKKRGKIEVNTVHKGNKKIKIVPPDILNHFPDGGKLAKYFPKIENGSLPKAESNSEYQERVRQFLSTSSENNNSK